MPQNFLFEIVEKKRSSPLFRARRNLGPAFRKEAKKARKSRKFAASLETSRSIGLIAEIKRASPSRGILCRDFDPVRLATIYEKAGARAISVLTEPNYFLGNLGHLAAVRKAVSLPLLRKDFLLEPWEVWESRAYGADAVLLIAALLNNRTLTYCLCECEEADMDALVEVHTGEELERVLSLGFAPRRIIGINNRNLESFETTLETTLRLMPRVPKGTPIVSESGISTPEDVRSLDEAGVRAVLVGAALVLSGDPGKTIRYLFGKVGKIEERGA
ncbi:MAG: indole-3-glycerol phosphate synthase TrpC [Armatimonadetes bacterium]|nr:indole-3-glycerol phosphate synthase TrpC [Armatimonadota bacterium]